MAVTDQLAVSYALYPKVIKDYLRYRADYGDTSVLDTETFLYGLTPNREILVSIEPGKTLVVSLSAVGELREDSTRVVHFELNGQPRRVQVTDLSVASDTPKRPKADPTATGQIGAPMPGNLLSVQVAVGDAVAEGDPLGVVEAMKLETTIRASTTGVIEQILVQAGERVEGGDLLFVIGAPKEEAA